MTRDPDIPGQSIPQVPKIGELPKVADQHLPFEAFHPRIPHPRA
jgi:hypothetical protein